MNAVLARLVSLLWGLVLLTSSCLSQATTYQDWWNNLDLSGMGLNIGQQEKTIFVTWFMYDEKGQPSFLLFYGDLDDSQSLTADLRRFYGPEPSGYDETLWYGEVVGTATISFSSPVTGTFSYQYGSTSGSFDIQRYTFRNINLSGTYEGRTVALNSLCGADEWWVGTDHTSVTHNGSDVAMTVTDGNGTTYDVRLNMTQHGTHFTGSGSIGSSNATGGTLLVTDMQLIDDVLTYKYVAIGTDGCRTDGTTADVKLAN